jgi:O-methyltransferase involved in polyketide biosynthesis
LALPPDFKWIELDLDHVIQFKEEALANESPNCQLVRRPARLENAQERKQILEELIDDPARTLILSEGFLLYLSESDVVNLSQDLRNLKIRIWVTDVNSPLTLKAMARVWTYQMGEKVEFQFGHEAARDFFNELGWKVINEVSLIEQYERFNRVNGLTQVRLLLNRVLGEGFRRRMARSAKVFCLSTN